MRKRQHLLPCFLLVAAIVCFLCISPAYSEFKRVNECELARTNASVTGQPVILNLCPASLDDAFECNPEDAFHACTPIPADGQSNTYDEGRLYTKKDEEENEWLKRTQDFLDVYNPVYNPLSPLTVEAGTDSDGRYAPYGSTYIRIGLGSQEVGLDEMDILVTLGGEAAQAAGREQILGSLYLAGLRVKTNGSSYVTMYKVDGAMGIGVNVDAAIDRIRLDTLSWGDADGFTGDTKIGDAGKAGYVGLKNTDISGIAVSGPVAIDVVTDDKGEHSLTKFIHMGIGTQDSQGHPVNNLNVGVASLGTTVVIGDKKDFSGNTGVLGELYMKDLAMNVNGYLDIYNPQDKVAATNLDFGLTIPTLTLNTLSWGDPDGFEGSPGAGGVGLKNLAISNLAIDGRATIGTETVQAGDGMTLLPVGTAFVHMGFSNLDVSMDSLNTDVALGNAKDNLNQVLGSVYLGGLKMRMDGDLDIHTPSASTQGIVLELDVNFPKINLDALSWGNDGGIGGMAVAELAGKTSAGFIGLSNLAIADLQVAGRVSIDVATIESPVAFTSSDLIKHYQMGPTFVRIGLGTGNSDILPSVGSGALFVGLRTLKTDIILDKEAKLISVDRGRLGSVYIENMLIGINGAVYIWAH